MMNQIISERVKNKKVIEVGTPCTFLSWSDRSPGTVSEILSPKTIRIESCKCEIIPKADGSSFQYGEEKEYEYFPRTNEEMQKEPHGGIYTLRKNGKWISKGVAMKDSNGVVMGYRNNYRDPSF